MITLKTLNKISSDVLDSSKNGILSINHEGQILFYNTARKNRFENFFAEDSVGKHISDMKLRILAELKNIIETGQAQHKNNLIRISKYRKKVINSNLRRYLGEVLREVKRL